MTPILPILPNATLPPHPFPPQSAATWMQIAASWSGVEQPGHASRNSNSLTPTIGLPSLACHAEPPIVHRDQRSAASPTCPTVTVAHFAFEALTPVNRKKSCSGPRGGLGTSRLDSSNRWIRAALLGSSIGHEGISFTVQSREARRQNAIICIRQLRSIMGIAIIKGPSSIPPLSSV
ncbi:hypothetical protein AOQ84DRAFT_74835 [Glonium stellatum]|uniref:Uncharacterized protein n=1 Tax=Glonium stellatum TaxID=574774 RepID=A0A8E2EXG2_9PEZI|nr:hypothetical protein AOQ84DRAFT_74835 [Glonium stellatum]